MKPSDPHRADLTPRSHARTPKRRGSAMHRLCGWLRFGLGLALALPFALSAQAQSRLQGASTYMNSPDHDYTLFAAVGGGAVLVIGGLIYLGTRKPNKKTKTKKRSKKKS